MTSISFSFLSAPSATPMANDRGHHSQPPMMAAAQVDLTSSERRISALANAGPLYSFATSEVPPPAENMAHDRQKRFVPVMLATDEIANQVIDEISVAITDNTITDTLVEDVTATEDDAFSRATVGSAAMGGMIAGHQAGMVAGTLQGGATGASEGALAGAVRGANAGGVTGGVNGALSGILVSQGQPEGAIWGEMAGTVAGRNAGRTAGYINGTRAGREAGATAGGTYGAAAGGIAGQQAGILAGRMVTDLATDTLMQHLPLEEQDDFMQFWRISEQHEHAVSVVARETAAQAAHQVGTQAGTRAGMLVGRRAGSEIGGREGEFAGARAGSDAGYFAGARAGEVIGQLARHPNRQTHISQRVDALVLNQLKHRG